MVKNGLLRAGGRQVIRAAELILLLVSTLYLASCGQPRDPIVSNSGVLGRQLLPEGSIVVELATIAKLTGPFQAEAADGANAVITLPPGADSEAKKGTRGAADVKVTVPAAGDYHGWLRAEWEDSCSNSVGLKCASLPEKIIGQDAVYHRWHWVDMGTLPLIEGEQILSLIQREDGVSFDQLLLTKDAAFQPTGKIAADSAASDLRRFGDDFMRSPGHGMEAWQIGEQWQLAFSFDPNRIPNQYALVGKSDGKSTALATPAGPAWNGVRLRVAIRPMTAGRFGAVLQRKGEQQQFAGIDIRDGDTAQAIIGNQKDDVPAGVFRIGQWHELVVEQWACVTRIIIDGRQVGQSLRSSMAPFTLSMAIAEGECVFDDVQLLEIPWAAEDAADQTARLPWQTPATGWFRPKDATAGWCLMGDSGAVQLRNPDHGARELLVTSGDSPEITTMQSTLTAINAEAATVAVSKPTYFQRIAVRFGSPEAPPMVTFGPYHFSEARVDDPSDYLDFTPEEYAAMQKSGEWDKLRREPKYRPVVGRDADEAVWESVEGRGRVSNGVLMVDHRGATVIHCRDIYGTYTVSMKVNLEAGSKLAVRPYSGSADNGLTLQTDAADKPGTLTLTAGQWHEVTMQFTRTEAAVTSPSGSQPMTINPGPGGELILAFSGAAQADDITIHTPTGNRSGGFYEFASRETNWWMDGETWLDHGGISCTLSSSWVSLISKADHPSMLWHKSPMPSDVSVSLYVQEFSEWYGWHQNPTHVHRSYENLILALAVEEDTNTGYRLEINAENHKKTILYRNGEAVATVLQDSRFPMRYVGGHQPFMPRTNNMRLEKSGSHITVLVDNVVVLNYEDPQPLAVSRVGFGGYRTHANFSNVEVLPGK